MPVQRYTASIVGTNIDFHIYLKFNNFRKYNDARIIFFLNFHFRQNSSSQTFPKAIYSLSAQIIYIINAFL